MTSTYTADYLIEALDDRVRFALVQLDAFARPQGEHEATGRLPRPDPDGGILNDDRLRRGHAQGFHGPQVYLGIRLEGGAIMPTDDVVEKSVKGRMLNQILDVLPRR